MATKLYTLGEMKDRHIGLVGTPEREEYERKVQEDVEAYHLGEAIRKARMQQNLSQQQLGDRIGVNRAQISKIETGGNIKITSKWGTLSGSASNTIEVHFQLCFHTA